MTVAATESERVPAIHVTGLPTDACPVERNILLGRVQKAARDFLNGTGRNELAFTIRTPGTLVAAPYDADGQCSGVVPEQCETVNRNRATEPSAPDDSAFCAVCPAYSWNRVILDADLRERIESAVEAVRQIPRLYDEWGLREIEPFPRAALNFHGPPGTGKTLTAHAVADMLGRPIIVASYAQIESKFLGDGPKNAVRLFESAEEANAVLFIDEADSLLSARLTNATQGSERAANSLTSQLLICLERFSGVVIFATNLLDNYDRAFDTRVQQIEFTLPGEEGRHHIWKKHLPERLPLADDVSIEELAKIDGVCGRDIRNTVIMAATRSVRAGQDRVSREMLLDSLKRVRESQERKTTAESSSNQLTDEDRQRILNRMEDPGLGRRGQCTCGAENKCSEKS